MTSTGTSPGPWLRLTALAATAATGLVVATGESALSHGVAALVAVALLVAVASSAWFAHRRRRPLVAASAVALAIFLLEVALGGAVALTGGAPWARGLHVALGAVSLAASAVAAVLAFSAGARTGRASWRDYLTLTKPRIMALLLVTAAGGMVVGSGGVPPLGLLAATLGGLALACGGASALNHVLDHDVDARMRRTARRPVAAGRIAPARALEFGVALSAASFVVLASLVNVLAALLAVAGNLFYVLVYTRVLKRSTPQNIVIGGAAGAVPPVVGWAAATGDLALPALFLFLIVFYWTPPHFWALALLIKRDYEEARIPMLPVVKGERETARSILRYSVVLVAISLLPVATRTLGPLYLASALALGAVFVALAVALRREVTPPRARRLFTYSLAYLALLFVAMALDPVALA
jgi:protoheme IX farnesyltransferase